MMHTLDRLFDGLADLVDDRTTRVGGISIHGWAFLVLISLAALLPGLASVPVMDRDEARYAQASRQMLETGNFVDIRFQEVPRHVKPAGTYWLQAGSAAMAGGPDKAEIWAYRLPSLLGALIAVLGTAWLGARIAGQGAGARPGVVGVVAGTALAVSLVLSVEARTAKTDALLLASVVVAQMALWSLLAADRAAPRFRGWPLVFWVAHGVGVLIKGPIVTLVLATTVAALCIWRRDCEALRRLKIGWGLLTTVVVVAPWLVAITAQVGPAFLEESVGHALMGKVARGDDAHGAPPGYHSLVFLVAFWPAMMLAPLAVAEGWRQRAEPAIRFLICWILPTLVVFELVVTKLPHYTLPVYPAVAILAGLGLVRANADDLLTGGWRRLHQVFTVLFVTLTLLLALVPMVAVVYLESVFTFGSVLALAAGLAVLWSGVRFMARTRSGRFLMSAAFASLFFLCTFHLTAPLLDTLWITRQMAAEVERAAECPDPVVAVAGFAEPSTVFILGTRTRLTEPAGAAAALAEEGCRLAVVDRRELPAFEAALDGLPVRQRARIEGLNYSKGREQDLLLFTRER